MPFKVPDKHAASKMTRKIVFLTMPLLTSPTIRVFPSLKHSTDCVRKPADNFRLCVCPFMATSEQNITARSRCLNCHLPIFLIADGNEFRFARFYIVCEEVPLGHQKVRSLSAVCRTHSVSVQTWQRHGMGCQPRHGRNT